jgi:hypothetical protein
MYKVNMPDRYVCQKQTTKRVLPSQKPCLEKQIPLTVGTVAEKFNLATAPSCSQSAAKFCEFDYHAVCMIKT